MGVAVGVLWYGAPPDGPGAAPERAWRAQLRHVCPWMRHLHGCGWWLCVGHWPVVRCSCRWHRAQPVDEGRSLHVPAHRYGFLGVPHHHRCSHRLHASLLRVDSYITEPGWKFGGRRHGWLHGWLYSSAASSTASFETLPVLGTGRVDGWRVLRTDFRFPRGGHEER